jgi:hypothetical protein
MRAVEAGHSSDSMGANAMRSTGVRGLWLMTAVFLAAATEGNAQLDVGDVCVESDGFAEVDFVFLIDATESMDREIAAVSDGLGSFVTGLHPAEIDARFAVVLFGGAPELVQDFSRDPYATEATFDSINVHGAVPGFQNNHNVNPEAGLEAIRITLGSSPELLDRTNVGGSDGLIFRPEARTILIVVADEDSDRPFHAANQLPGQTTINPPDPISGSDWQIEVDATARAVIENDVFLNLFVNPKDLPSESQYGAPSQVVADADFLTLLALEGAGFGDNLQAQVLRSGLCTSFNLLKH